MPYLNLAGHLLPDLAVSTFRDTHHARLAGELDPADDIGKYFNQRRLGLDA